MLHISEVRTCFQNTWQRFLGRVVGVHIGFRTLSKYCIVFLYCGLGFVRRDVVLTSCWMMSLSLCWDRCEIWISFQLVGHQGVNKFFNTSYSLGLKTRSREKWSGKVSNILGEYTIFGTKKTLLLIDHLDKMIVRQCSSRF